MPNQDDGPTGAPDEARFRGSVRPSGRAWACYAVAAVLHATVLSAGALSPRTEDGRTEQEAIDEIRRYLAAGEDRTAPRPALLEKGARVLPPEAPEGEQGAGEQAHPPLGEASIAAAARRKQGALADRGEGTGAKSLGRGAWRAPQPKERYGELPAEAVIRVVRQNFGLFRTCYEAMLGNGGYPMGTVRVRFVIAENGTVSASQLVSNNLPSSKLGSCVVSAFRALKFPEPRGGPMRIVYPISFYPWGG